MRDRGGGIIGNMTTQSCWHKTIKAHGRTKIIGRRPVERTELKPAKTEGVHRTPGVILLLVYIATITLTTK